MSATTSIEWTDHTFNPWRGCAKVHLGCTHCYAEKNVGVAIHGIAWGEVWSGGQRVIADDSTWRHPRAWARAAAKAGVRRRVFCASLADVLEVPEYPPFQHLTTERRERVNEARRALDEARAKLWDVIRETAHVCQGCQRPHAMSADLPGRTARLSDLASVGAACEGRDGRCVNTASGGLDWLLLTKRPQNWELVPEDVRPFVWLGTSASDQGTWDSGADELAKAEGFAQLFVSLEPMVAAVDMGLGRNRKSERVLRWYRPLKDSIGWVIVGGESGSKARPCHVEWVRNIVRQCRAAGVPCFVKQLGEVPVLREPAAGEDPFIPDREWPQGTLFGNYRRVDGLNGRVPRLNDKKGGDMAEWPEDLRVREVPHG
ncbi:DUF5131 family protein [Myxococcus xanthus]|uniref:DUF5131 family protein n=1 Tax=Myxococcus xanthus TaxID=34 RepID=UPI00112E631F|nr:DUF5131 family protein [Myxococcus xanthus]QDE83270.1 hypothetical protein BHS07_17860 [Myxococcus xanthus]